MRTQFQLQSFTRTRLLSISHFIQTQPRHRRGRHRQSRAQVQIREEGNGGERKTCAINSTKPRNFIPPTPPGAHTHLPMSYLSACAPLNTATNTRVCDFVPRRCSFPSDRPRFSLLALPLPSSTACFAESRYSFPSAGACVRVCMCVCVCARVSVWSVRATGRASRAGAACVRSSPIPSILQFLPGYCSGSGPRRRAIGRLAHQSPAVSVGPSSQRLLPLSLSPSPQLLLSFSVNT